MKKAADELACRVTTGAAWVMCPVCRRGKLLKLAKETRARDLILFCRNCKQEVVVEIGPGEGPGSLPQARLAVRFSGQSIPQSG